MPPGRAGMVHREIGKDLMRIRLLLFIAAASQVCYAGLLPFSLDSCVRACMAAWQVPGAAVAIVKDDSLVACKGYGVCRVGEKKPVDGKTVFAIGSATTAFTATTVGLLVKDGMLSWDDTVSTRLPSFRLFDECSTRGITIRDLLCHRCGFAARSGDLLWYGSQYTDDTIISRLRFLKPDFGLRSRFGYSNLMYLVAGKVAAVASGTSWNALVRKRLLEPLEMSRTKTSVRELSGLQNVAEPHTIAYGKVTSITYRMLDNIGAAGAINASAEDLAKWLRLQLNYGTYNGARIVDSAVIRETRTPHMLMQPDPGSSNLFPATNFNASGLGWMLSDYYGRLLVYVGGRVDGMQCFMGFAPDERLGIVVLTNLDNHKCDQAVFYEIIDGYLGIPSRDWSGLFTLQRSAEQRKVNPGPSRTMQEISKPERYVGTYRNDLYGTATVFRSGRDCVLHLTAHPGLEGILLSVKGDTTACAWRDRYFGSSFPVFVFDSMGMARAFSLRVREDWVDPLEYRFERTAGTGR